MRIVRSASLVASSALLATVVVAAPAWAALTVTDLTSALEPSDLAGQLAGTGVTVGNVTFTGDDRAAGTFTGGTGIIGFDAGVVLSSGAATDVVGPNESSSTTTSFGLPGDADLDVLSGVTTHDAAVLEFEFVPDADTVYFQYVFGSEEYNEYVSEPLTGVNDVFAFFVNGTNCATVPNPDEPSTTYPVTITTVNNGQPGVDPVNPHLYINNDPFNPDSTGSTVASGDLLDTEMDGLTVVLTCQASVNAGVTNTMRLAIADGGDSVLDSWVMIQAGSLTTDPDPDPDPEPRTAYARKLWIDADGTTVSETTPAGVEWSATVTAGGTSYPMGPTAEAISFEVLPGGTVTISEVVPGGYTQVTGTVVVGETTLTCVGDGTHTATFPAEGDLVFTICNQAQASDPDPDPIAGCSRPAASSATRIRMSVNSKSLG
jgi:hypothetical protein